MLHLLVYSNWRRHRLGCRSTRRSYKLFPISHGRYYGRVYAWEPDDLNYECLLHNIKEHGLANVVPVKKALDSKTGTAKFQMDGTMSAGLHDYLFYADARAARTVETLSMADASGEYGAPVYVKTDIEGAELAVVGGALEFLRSDDQFTGRSKQTILWGIPLLISKSNGSSRVSHIAPTPVIGFTCGIHGLLRATHVSHARSHNHDLRRSTAA